MILICVAVFDGAIQAFGRPFFVRSRAEAVRTFSDEVRRAESPMAAHPSDYAIHVLGEFEDSSGSFVPIHPEVLLRGADVPAE